MESPPWCRIVEAPSPGVSCLEPKGLQEADLAIKLWFSNETGQLSPSFEMILFVCDPSCHLSPVTFSPDETVSSATES